MFGFWVLWDSPWVVVGPMGRLVCSWGGAQGGQKQLILGPTFHLQLPYLSIQHPSEKNRHIVRDAEKHGESIAPIHIGHLPPRLTEISGPVPARVVKTSFIGSWDSPILHKVLILRFCGQEKIYSRGHLLEGVQEARYRKNTAS